MNFDKFLSFIWDNLDILQIEEIKFIVHGKYNELFKTLNQRYKTEKNNKNKEKIENIIVFLTEFIQDYQENRYKYNPDFSVEFDHYAYWFDFYIKNKFLPNAKNIIWIMRNKFIDREKDVSKLEKKLNNFEKKYMDEYGKIKVVVDKNNKLKHIELLVGQWQFGEAMHECIKYLQDYPNDQKVQKYLKKIDELKSSNVMEIIDVNYEFFEKVWLLNLTKTNKLQKSDVSDIYKKMDFLIKTKDHESGLMLIKYLKDRFNIEDPKIAKYNAKFLEIRSNKQKSSQEEEYKLELKSLKLLYENKQYQDAIIKANTILKKYPLVDKNYILTLLSKVNKEKNNLLKARSKSKFEIWFEELQIKSANMNKKWLYWFYEKMAWFLRAKMDLKLTLQVIYYQARDYGVKKFVKSILEWIDNWIKISELLRWNSVVGRLDVSLIKIWETTWKLWDMFQAIYKSKKEEDDRNKKIKWMMIYPIVVITVTVGIFIWLLIYIIPKFTSFYGSMWMDLPALTLFMIAASDFLRTQWYILIWIIFVLSIWIKMLKRTEYWQYLFSALSLKVPVFKLLSFKKEVIYFSWNVSLLLKSWINLLEALDLVIYWTDNLLFKDEYRRIRFELETWVNFSKAVWLWKLEDIWEYNNIYIPIDLAYAIDIWEKTWQLGELLSDVSIRYDEDLQQLIKNLQSLMEPFIIVLLWVVVLIFVASIFLPLMNMYNVLGKMSGV